MARDHIAVVKNPEPNSKGWVMLTGTGEPPEWKITSGNGKKKLWTQEAVRTAISRDMSVDVTISSAPPKAVMADPDSIEDGYNLLVICRDISRRWAILAMEKDGTFRLNGIEAGRGIHLLLERIATETTDTLLDRSAIWIRPGMRASDLLSREKLAAYARRAA